MHVYLKKRFPITATFKFPSKQAVGSKVDAISICVHYFKKLLCFSSRVRLFFSSTLYNLALTADVL